MGRGRKTDFVTEPLTIFPVGPKDRGKRLDLYLKERIPGLSRARLQRAIRTRVFLSWDATPRPSTPVRPGGEVRIGHDAVHEDLLEIEIPIIARGEGWLAVDKPAGIPVHPVNRIVENSLIRILRRQEDNENLRLVHRLDRETSGILLIATDPETARFLARAFERGRVRKEYLAIVAGEPTDDHGVIDSPIGAAERSRVFVRRQTTESGQHARTEWRVVLRFGHRTLLRIHPRTGRRHQIRVHLASIGHPVLGDPLYGRPDADYLDMVSGARDRRTESDGPKRQLLHASRLEFPDPSRHGTTVIESPLPPDIVAAYELADGLS